MTMMNDREWDLITMGQLLVRLSPPGFGRLSRAGSLDVNVGGAELNVAAGAAELGLRTAFFSRLADNAVGDMARSVIRSFGVSDRYLLRDPSPDSRVGLYYYEYAAAPRTPLVVYDRKDPGFYGLRPEDADPAMFRAARCFHVSGITLGLGPQVRETAIRCMKAFREAGALISFDVNFRANLWTGEEARQTIREILPLVDIFFCSDSTALLTFGLEGSPREKIRAFAEEFPLRAVFSTIRTIHEDGTQDFGSCGYDAASGAFFEEAPYTGIRPIDRIGSGDAYCAGVLAGLLSGEEAFGEKAITRAVRCGNAAAALKNSVAGDLPQMTRKEVEALMEAHATGAAAGDIRR